MCNAKTDLGEELGREYVIVVAAGAVSGLVSGSLKAAALRTAEEGSESRRLEGVEALPANAAAQVILFSGRVIALDIEACGLLAERQIGCVIIRRAGQRLGGIQDSILSPQQRTDL